MKRPLLLATWLGLVLSGCRDDVLPVEPRVPSPDSPPSRGVLADLPADFALTGAVASEIYADSNLVGDGTTNRGPYPRDVVWVLFRGGTTASERAAVVEAADGSVIAAASEIGEGGGYYIRLHKARNDRRILKVVELLAAFPQVAHASPDLTLLSNSLYRRPHDGNGWRRGSWRMDPADRNGQNWALEAVNAPLAWGCEVGS